MKFIHRAGAVAALAGAAMPLQAQDGAATAKLFGARQSVLGASISPDGTGIAFIAPGPGSSEVLYTVDLGGNATARGILRVAEPNEDLTGCSWATNSRLICRLYTVVNDAGTLIGFTRLYALNEDGSEVQELTGSSDRTRALGIVQNGGTILALNVAGEENKVLMTRQFVPESQAGTILARSDEGLGIEEVDITNGRRKTVEGGKAATVWYLADENGTPRMMATQRSDGRGYERTEMTYHFRAAGSRDWQPFATVATDMQSVFGFSPSAVESGKDVVYGFEPVDGRQALVSYSLDGRKERQVLVARDDVDVDGLLRIGRRDRVVGASYATERRQIEFFDPELKALADSLGKALPGQPLIEFVDASEDESKLLLIASSDVDPGKLYLFDKTTKKLAVVLPMRPALAQQTLAAMKPITFAAADGTSIPGYLTLPPGSDGKNLPAIVLPHGGPSSRDEWGFDWLVQFFAARGYAVLQPNFRGSSGYGSAWFQENGFRSWRTAVGDVNDAGRWLVAEGIADPAKLAVVGWSYGGYAALQTQALDPQLYKAVVAIAPVTDLAGLVEAHRRFTDFKLVEAFVGQGPHVAEGSPAQQAARFAAPVLLFHGDFDQNVPIAQSRVMADQLKDAGKPVRLIEFDGLDHYVDDAEQRPRMLTEIDTFLRASLAG